MNKVRVRIRGSGSVSVKKSLMDPEHWSRYPSLSPLLFIVWLYIFSLFFIRSLCRFLKKPPLPPERDWMAAIPLQMGEEILGDGKEECE